MKGIILAGGSGTRLYPATYAMSKQLIPIYDKPMVYYPLSLLLFAGIREIFLISTPEDISRFEKLLGNGSKWGVSISYGVQEHPNGLAEAFLIAEKFIDHQPCAMVLGDNLFFGSDLPNTLQEAARKKTGATIFAYKVKEPQRYGIIEFTKEGKPKSIEEKPAHSKSRYAVTGLYFYDEKVVEYAKSLTPSKRGELEITDLNRLYLQAGTLEVQVLNRGFAWLDTGTFESLMEASQFIETIQKRQGLKIACLEEIAYRMGYISLEHLTEMVYSMPNNSYREYLEEVMEENNDL